jgi:AraC family transcriptional regulator
MRISDPTTSAVGPRALGAADSRAEPALETPNGLRLDLHTYEPGLVELVPSVEHRLLIHAGGPVRGSCQRQRYTYTRGDLDLVPAGKREACVHEQSATQLVLQLSPALLRRVAENMGVDPDRASVEPRCQFRDPQLEHIVWALDVERMQGQLGGQLYTDSLGLALAAHLLRRFPAFERARRRAPRGLTSAQLARVKSYIEDHIDRDLSMQRLASVAEVSSSHLKTAFRRSTGLAVHQYVVQRRVARARALLLRGELPASQIALEAGFAHQSHMARCMRRVLGITPSALQNM